MSTINERKQKLIEAYKDDKDILDTINDTLDSYGEYIKVINDMENSIAVARFTLEPDEYRRRIESLDRRRRIEHNCIISGTKLLNRLAKEVDLELFFEGDVTNRLEVAEFAMMMVRETFDNRKK